MHRIATTSAGANTSGSATIGAHTTTASRIAAMTRMKIVGRISAMGCLDRVTRTVEQKLFTVAPYFIVDDILQSAAFYRDKLGFQFDRIWGQPPQFVIVHRDDVYIMLKSIGSAGNSRPNHTVHADAPWDAYIWVKDADALYDELRSRGVKITREIENEPYGCRDFDVEDNSGYIICFGQNLEA